jgi:hypothetical protein
MIAPFEAGELLIAPTSVSSARALCFEWKGRSAARSPADVLAPFFDGVLSEAESHGATVEMRFDRLTHVNSSTVGALLAFIERARQKQVPLTLVYDGNTKWQRLSFGAMRVLSQNDGLFELKAL